MAHSKKYQAQLLAKVSREAERQYLQSNDHKPMAMEQPERFGPASVVVEGLRSVRHLSRTMALSRQHLPNPWPIRETATGRDAHSPPMILNSKKR